MSQIVIPISMHPEVHKFVFNEVKKISFPNSTGKISIWSST
jgi:hypothetical protein